MAESSVLPSRIRARRVRSRCRELAPWRRPGAVLVALVIAAVLPAGAAAAEIPTPDRDPFYAAPAELESHAPGAVLRSREVTVTGRGVPIPVHAWQVLYRSNDSKERPIAAVATILVPLTPYPAGERPLLSYQMAIDSLGPQCNPSYTLRTGTQKELVAVAPSALALGWAVVVPDFEGPRNAYGAGPVAAHTVLDGIRAAQRFEPAGLGAGPVGLWGYSGGGQATAWAAERQPGYAPELEIAGVAAGGVPPDLEQVARQIDGGIFFGIYAAVSVGLSREFPELDIDSLLNERGRALKEQIGTQCAEDLVTGYPFGRMADYTTVGDPLAVPRVRDVIEANRLGRSAPTAPTFVYHAVLDQLIPIAGPDELVAEWCRAGAKVLYERSLAGEHVAYAVTGGAAAVTYLTARFAGLPARTNCR